MKRRGCPCESPPAWRNRLEQGIAHKPMIVEVFYDLKGDCRVVYHDLYLGGPTAKGVGLRVASSHTGNHREDDFTPLETIQRFLGIIGSRSLSSSKGRPSSQMGGTSRRTRVRTVNPLIFFMDAKFIIASQTCTLTKDELSQLVTDYDIPQDVRVLLPKRSQTILDAPLGFVGLYTYHFTLSNIRLPIPEFICEVLNYFKVHIFHFNIFGMVKLTTFAVMCKEYGGEQSLDLLWAFLNLGHAGDWLTLSNRGGACIPKALTKPMDFRSFMVGGIDGEFHFEPEGGFAGGEGNSPSNMSVNNEAPVIDVAPLNSSPPSHVAENVGDSNDVSLGEDIVGETERLRNSSKVAGKRKQATGPSVKEVYHKLQKASPQVSKVTGDASDPLDVDSDPNIHGKFYTLSVSFVLSTCGSKLIFVFPEFPSAKELKDSADCHFVVAHAVLDNMLNSQTRQLMPALEKARA
ncbi:hypothetical protein Tco_0844376 [Tanacetum coccineum]